jgi:hypothetical protein
MRPTAAPGLDAPVISGPAAPAVPTADAAPPGGDAAARPEVGR